VLFQGRGLCLTEAFMRGVRLLGEYAMSFDLCIPAGQLADGAKLVESCPGTRFIVDHCGNADPKAFRPATGGQKKGRPSHDPDQWRRDMARLARAKNTVCKISGIVARAPKGTWRAEDLAPVINHCLDSFGPDRVMFGSDWPVCTRVASYRQWVTALKDVVRGRSHEQQRKLFHDNAVRFYGL
jgi:predicted TIM-barrel fold metal-dependent hydrolase